MTLQMPVSATDPTPVPVLLDPGTLARGVRTILSTGTSLGASRGALPRLLTAVAAGHGEQFGSQLSRAFHWDQPYCVGYLPKCLPAHRPSLGVVYSTLCHDIAPFSDPSVPPGLDAAISEAYGKSPYLRRATGGPSARPIRV